MRVLKYGKILEAGLTLRSTARIITVRKIAAILIEMVIITKMAETHKLMI